jgi:membrane dipeptidase
MKARTIVTRRVVCFAALCVSLVVAPVAGQGGPPPAGQAAPPAQDEAALVAKAKGIHQRVITLDTHNDISPNNFTPECNYTMRLTTQVNLPKMVEGGMDVSFMIAYVGQGPLTPEGYDNAYRQAIAKFEAVNRLTEQIAPTQIGLALTADDVVRLHNQGKRIAVIGIENGYPIGMDINRVKEFWQKGGRYMSLAHNGHSQLADSNTGEANNEWMWGGLSPLGKQVIAEMNKWGIMVDVSHPSKGSMMQAVALSKAPIIASHSAVRALADVSRNLDDEQLIAIKQNGGVVQVVAFASYVKADPPGRGAARAAAMAQLREQFGIAAAGRGGGGGGGRGGGGGGGGRAAGAAPAGGAPATPPCSIEQPGQTGRGGRGGGGGRGAAAPAGVDALTPEQRTQYELKLAKINADYPPAPRATVKDFVDHIDYAVKLIGIDHVGISSDFDGGGGVDGWNSAAEAFNVTLELVRRGYTEEQVGKIWSGNLLRVWRETEQIAKKIQSGEIK